MLDEENCRTSRFIRPLTVHWPETFESEKPFGVIWLLFRRPLSSTFGNNKMDENQVIENLLTHLKNNGWNIISFVPAGVRGIDVVACDENNRKWYIEAKGGTSSNPNSARYSKPYTKSQVFDVTSKGLMQCFHHLANNDGDINVGFAYPGARYFGDYMDPIKPMLSSIGVTLFCVCEDLTVVESLAKNVAEQVASSDR